MEASASAPSQIDQSSDDEMAEPRLAELPWRERVCKSDSTKFMKYIKSTPTHGVVHIFTGKSKIRQVFWLLIVVGAGAFCLFNIIDRIEFLISQPTLTAFSLIRRESLTFPAITVCNLNPIRLSYLQNLTGSSLEDVEVLDTTRCNVSALQDVFTDMDLDLRKILNDSRHLLEELVQECHFMGKNCSFTPVLTRVGFCYEFNGGRNGSVVLSSAGTGPRFGLQMTLNIEQDEYSQSLNDDAGAILVIHPQGEPGEPSDAGITVPPGHGARVGLRKKIVKDLSSTATCKHGSSNNFNFLSDVYQYSLSACLVESFFTTVARRCGCIDSSVARPSSGEFATLPDCQLSDLCCSLDVYYNAERSGCSSACHYTTYQTSVSYSSFPAKYATESLAAAINTSEEYVKENLLSVSVFFEDLNVEEVVTRDAYSYTALLSDIGGQLGLFLGASVVSILEFFLWVLDETKDRCVGVNDRKILAWLRRNALIGPKKIKMRRQKTVAELEMEIHNVGTKKEGEKKAERGKKAEQGKKAEEGKKADPMPGLQGAQGPNRSSGHHE